MGIGFKELLIILVIVLVLFGAKRLRTLGGDLGSALKGFRSAVKEGEDTDKDTLEEKAGRTIDAEVVSKEKDKV
ncbi:MAG TPA: twin-arginine translocase TatA/TatE family subunit [Gammaproteobacteria bacterium]|jgi:sec-independent protein translocase protein TatA|nr:twin-arginine translocase TatA/TatE family subunit [Gammaproteobacteria bacterium]